jgi:hypothetical protein
VTARRCPRGPIVTSPRVSSLRSAAVSLPVQRGSEASSAAWRSVSFLCGRLRPQRRLLAAGWRQHQAERARRRRDVLLGHPQRQLDELGRHAVGQHPQRIGERVLGVRRQPCHHGLEPLVAERHLQDRADADRLHPARPPVVERPAQRAGRRQRLDLDDVHPHRD